MRGLQNQFLDYICTQIGPDKVSSLRKYKVQCEQYEIFQSILRKLEKKEHT